MAAVLSLLLLVIPCFSHQMLRQPHPRERLINRANAAPTENAPCGSVTFAEAYAANRTTEWTAGSKVEIIVWEDIFHEGNPMRISISGENNEEFEDCIIFNHIPRHARGDAPAGGRNLTIEMTVPDMNCMNCTLQVFGLHFPENRNDDQCCAYNNNGTESCGRLNYYSCANINIKGGKRDRKDVCVQPTDWAYRDLPCNYYKSEASQRAWTPVTAGDESAYILKTSGSIDGFGASQKNDFCKDSTREENYDGIPPNYDCHRTATNFKELSLLEGGDMQTDGVVAIIVIFVLICAISATYFIAKKRGLSAVPTSSPSV